MACNSCPVIFKGTQLLSFKLSISACMRRSGSMIRFIGRVRRESSPSNWLTNGLPAKIPEISRVVVPLFPASKICCGSFRPCNPFPWTSTRLFSRSISMPISWKQEIVERQSAPSKKLVISVVPLESEPNIIARWEMDLSPGIFISPCKAWAFLICIIKSFLDVFWNIVNILSKYYRS